jgi:hypothetical protein
MGTGVFRRYFLPPPKPSGLATFTLGPLPLPPVGTPGNFLLASWTAESYHAHFIGRGYTTWRDKIDAGYPIYIQPAALTGTYTEIIDFGVILNNAIISISYNTFAVTPDSPVVIVTAMGISDDGIFYTPFVNGAVQFYPSFRYLKLRLSFTSADDLGLVYVYNLTANVEVKRENDGGSVVALAGDALGTSVTFNKAFKDIESLTATVRSTTVPFVVVIDFSDIPNPTFFKVYVYNAAGARVTEQIDWKARGIL